MEQTPGPPDGSAERRTSLAEERTRIALDRTLLAWWRTALACYGIGIAVARALPAPAQQAALFRWLGVSFVVAGISIVALGFTDTGRAYRASLGGRPRAATVALTGLFLLIGLACLALTVPA